MDQDTRCMMVGAVMSDLGGCAAMCGERILIRSRDTERNRLRSTKRSDTPPSGDADANNNDDFEGYNGLSDNTFCRGHNVHRTGGNERLSDRAPRLSVDPDGHDGWWDLGPDARFSPNISR